MSTVRLIRRPRAIDSHTGGTSVLAVGYEDKMIAYVDKTGQLLPVGMYEGTSCSKAYNVLRSTCDLLVLQCDDMLARMTLQVQQLEQTSCRPAMRRYSIARSMWPEVHV